MKEPAAPKAKTMLDLPMYEPITTFPIVKKSAVRTAAAHTSAHATWVSGRSLNIMASKSAVIPNDSNVPESGERKEETGIRPDTNFVTAASPALEANDTISKNTAPNTRTKDSNRFLSCPAKRLPDLGLTLQILLSAS